MRCGAPAGRSQRLSSSGERVEVGATGMYEARCRHCYEPEAEATPQLPLEALEDPAGSSK